MRLPSDIMLQRTARHRSADGSASGPLEFKVMRIVVGSLSENS